MTEHEIEVEHDGRHYLVKVEVEWEEFDDSFDHEFGTEHLYHFEPKEWEVLSCVDTEDGQEVEPEHVTGLSKAIKWEVRGLEHPYE